MRTKSAGGAMRYLNTAGSEFYADRRLGLWGKFVACEPVEQIGLSNP